MPAVLNSLSQGQQVGPTMVSKLSDHRHRAVFKELQPADLQAATDLIVDEYVDQGYLPSNNLSLCKLKMLESLRLYRMFGAWENGRLVAVLGLTCAESLPMEAVFSNEIRLLRGSGFRLGEIGKFASMSALRSTVLRLMLFVAQVASEELDYIVLTVNPRHHTFYTSIAGFTPLSYTSRPLSSVCNAPAIGLYARPKQVLSCTRARRSLRIA
jgi:hypothetical protein